MPATRNAYRGCLLGMAVGDAMGYPVDAKNWQEIQQAYGPNGLLGYDLTHGYADVTSYTQLAAFTCNGLLLGRTFAQMKGEKSNYIRYIALADREWCASQRPWGRPERNYCWLMHSPQMCRRLCMDTRMMDTINRGKPGTPAAPVNNFQNPGAITTAVGVGLFFDPERVDPIKIDRLGAAAVALTHGSPLAFLTGAAVAHIVSHCVRDRNTSLKELYLRTVEMLEEQFGHKYSQTYEICSLIRQAIHLAEEPKAGQQESMERLGCDNAAQVLAGTVYATLACRGDFDSAMIIAVNHSGRGAAVGALTGAILGARMGVEALPDFYMECLEPAEVLTELAEDLYQGCPMVKGNRLFDGGWDRKYLHGGR